VLVLIRGGGDLASGVAVRLHHSGFEVMLTELPTPLVVRRTVSFAEAVSDGSKEVEGITAILIRTPGEVREFVRAGNIPVLVDPDLTYLKEVRPDVVVDARMRKKPPAEGKELATLVIGLGPGFIAGENCHTVIETNRGHNLGRVIWAGPPQEDTGIPGMVQGFASERILRAPEDGKLVTGAKIGDEIKNGTVIALVGSQAILAPFDGVLRGLIKPGTQVIKGMKIGDVDPRDDSSICTLISDKSRAVGGGVLEAILACPDLRSGLWI
jgi:xanthine dehydrogenase accessory factor